MSGNIRDAAIKVEGGGQRAEKTNTGFVPLNYFLFDWRFSRPWSFRIAEDVLGGPQGRAEDVLFAMLYDVNASTKVIAGYRVLEGGADTIDVYAFSLFHSAVAAIEMRFLRWPARMACRKRDFREEVKGCMIMILQGFCRCHSVRIEEGMAGTREKAVELSKKEVRTAPVVKKQQEVHEQWCEARRRR